ncbi:MAG: translation initiation factor [Bacteroidota bacterium]
MSAKKRKEWGGNVYSEDEFHNEEMETLLPEEQDLIVQLDKKSRAGKVVTLIHGFVGKHEDLKELCRLLKNKCGVGGSAKDGEIIIQGSKIEKICEILESEGYTFKHRRLN